MVKVLPNVFLTVGLILWLMISLGFWMIGIGFGGAALPHVNLHTALGFYAPWLILAVVIIRTLWKPKKD